MEGKSFGRTETKKRKQSEDIRELWDKNKITR